MVNISEDHIREIYRDAATEVLMGGMRAATFPLPNGNYVKIIFGKTPITDADYRTVVQLVGLLKDSLVSAALSTEPTP